MKLTLVAGLLLFTFFLGFGPQPGGQMALFAPATPAMAQDLTPVQRGRGKAQMCTRCHGRYGLAKAANAQNWTGSVEEFIIAQLQAFREKKRDNLVMYAVAKPMSDLDMADVAAWYEKVSGAEKSQ